MKVESYNEDTFVYKTSRKNANFASLRNQPTKLGSNFFEKKNLVPKNGRIPY